MKNIKVERRTETAFEPIHVEFDIETKDELLSMLHTLNMDIEDVETVADAEDYPIPDEWAGNVSLWNMMDDYWEATK